MQLKEAKKLRENWHGGECKHLERVKEYDLGTDTGDYVCTKCGEAFSRAEHQSM